jgi:hypothetical protein
MKKNPAALACLALLASFAVHADNRNEHAGTPFVLREAERTLTLAPGQRDFVMAACIPGVEVAVGGSPSSISPLLEATLTYFSWDGAGSGWSTVWINRGTETVTTTVSQSALCMKGAITYGGLTTMFPN